MLKTIQSNTFCLYTHAEFDKVHLMATLCTDFTNIKNCNPHHLPQKSVFHCQYSFCLNSCGHFNRQQTDWNQLKARKTESYRPGAPVMTCRVLRVGGGMASVRSRCLCCCSFIIAASKAGDEGDLLWTRCTRAWPGLRAWFGLWPERNHKKNKKKFKHTSRQKKSGHSGGKIWSQLTVYRGRTLGCLSWHSWKTGGWWHNFNMCWRKRND